MPLGLTLFTQDYNRGYKNEMLGYFSEYNAKRGNSFSFNIESFRNEAYCVGYEDAWRISEIKNH